MRGKKWHLYLVRCADESIYTGIALDVEARVKAHNQGKGAKYTAQRRPVSLLYQEQLPNQGRALKRELQVKRWGKERKENLARGLG